MNVVGGILQIKTKGAIEMETKIKKHWKKIADDFYYDPMFDQYIDTQQEIFVDRCDVE